MSVSPVKRRARGATTQAILGLVLSVLLLFAAIWTLGRTAWTDDSFALMAAGETLDRFREVAGAYGQLDTALIGFEAPDEPDGGRANALTKERLEALRTFTRTVEKDPQVAWVSSLANVLDMQPGEEDLEVAPLLDGVQLTPSGLAGLREKLKSRPHILSQLISPDFAAFVTVVTFRPGQSPEGIDRVEALAREIGGERFGVTVFGAAAAESYARRAGASAALPGMLGGVLSLLLLAVVFRRLNQIILGVALLVVPGVTGLAVAAQLVQPLPSIAAVALLPLAALGLTASGFSPVARAEDTVGRIRRARNLYGVYGLLLGSVFSTLAMSEIVAVRAVGVTLAAGCLTFVVLAGLLLGVYPDRPGSVRPNLPTLRPLWFIPPAAIVALALVIVAARPVPHLLAGVPFTFWQGEAPREAIEVLNRRFGGSDIVTVRFRGDFENPAMLVTIDRMANRLRAMPELFSQVIAPADVFRLTNRAMTGIPSLPETTGETRNLWFFLEGQNELSALFKAHSEGLMQVRLAAQTMRAPFEAVRTLREEVARLPLKVGRIDVREVKPESRGEARQEARIQAVAKALHLFRQTVALTPDERASVEPSLNAMLTAVDPYLPAGAARAASVVPQVETQLRAELTRLVATTFAPDEGPFDLPAPAQGELVDRLVTDLSPGAAQPAGLRARVRALLLPHAAAVAEEAAARVPRVARALVNDAYALRVRVFEAVLTPALLKTFGRTPALTPTPALRDGMTLVMREFLSPWRFVDGGGAQSARGTTTFHSDVTGFPMVSVDTALAARSDVKHFGLALSLFYVTSILALLFSRGQTGTGNSLAGLIGGVTGGVAALTTAVWIVGFGPAPLGFAALATTLAFGAAAGGLWLAPRHPMIVLWALAFALMAPFLALALGSSLGPVIRLSIQVASGLFGAALGATWVCGREARATLPVTTRSATLVAAPVPEKTRV